MEHTPPFIMITGTRMQGLYGLDKEGLVWRLVYNQGALEDYWIPVTNEARKS